jgi:hypothetical protein
MSNQILNFVNISLEDMTCIMREIVASELQKAKGFISPNPIDDLDKILTREEVCKLLKVSNTTLFHWHNDKVLVNHKIGRRVYYMKAEVMDKLNPLRLVS